MTAGRPALPAGVLARVALEAVEREYPHMPLLVVTGPGEVRPHRERHPAFFGAFDWHSSVAMQWALARLLRRSPDAVDATAIRSTLDAHLTSDHLARELAVFAAPEHRTLERPYGWGWLLTLAAELAAWEDPDAGRWSAAVEPLARHLGDELAGWLPRLAYPVRTGVHQSTAFALARSLDHAVGRARGGDARLLHAIRDAARRLFLSDAAYPAAWEPSGTDFLSPALCEAALMARVLPTDAFPSWLDRFLPGLERAEPASLLEPVAATDAADGHLAHLHGLALSRAWAFERIAAALPSADARRGVLRTAADHHLAAGLPAVEGSDWMVEHWLAAYATLALDPPDGGPADAAAGPISG